MLGHQSISSNAISTTPVATAGAATPVGIGSFVSVPPQIDPRVIAGSAVFFMGSLFGAHSNTAMGAEYQFGTHELAIKQAAQVSSVWSSVRTPPAGTPNPIANYVRTEPQFNPTQVQSAIFEPSFNAQGWISTSISTSQDDPSQIQSQVWKSVAAAVAVTTGSVPKYLQTAPQFDPTQIQPKVWPSQFTPPVLTGTVPPFINAVPQFNPTQVQPVVWPSQLTVTYGVETWVQTKSQDDPTQIPSQIWSPSVTPPTILGPTLPAYLFVAEQIDTNRHQPQPITWTPSTFSPSGPIVIPDQPSGGWEPLHHFEAARKRRDVRKERERQRQEDAREIQEELDRQIAKTLYEQEQKDAERDDLERIQRLADSLMVQKTDLHRPILAAAMKAHEERTVNALQQLERVISQTLEEEELALLMLLLMDD